MKILGGRTNLSVRLVAACCILSVFLLITLSYTILQSAYAQRLPSSGEQERLIEESTPQLPSGEQERLIEESTPQLIEELASRGGFLMPVEDIREILEVKEKAAAAAPLAIAGTNVYVVWWENKTGNWEVFFRASSDNGKTFRDEINLSNDTTRSDDANIAAQGNLVYITWWNTNNQSSLREPFFIASDDNGATFGEKIRLSRNESMQTPAFEVFE